MTRCSNANDHRYKLLMEIRADPTHCLSPNASHANVPSSLRDGEVRRTSLRPPGTRGLLPSQKEQLQSLPSSVTWFQRQHWGRNCRGNNNCTTPNGQCGYSHPHPASLSVAQALWQLRSQGIGVYLKDALKRGWETGWREQKAQDKLFEMNLSSLSSPNIFWASGIVPECCSSRSQKTKNLSIIHIRGQCHRITSPSSQKTCQPQ